MDWYLVHMLHGQEQFVALHLASRFPLTVYCPEVLRWQRTDQWTEPLFPGYLFAQPRDVAVDLAAVDSTPGCGRIVRCVSLPNCPERSCTEATAPVLLCGAALGELQGRLADVNAAGGLPVTILPAPAGSLDTGIPSLLDALSGLLAPSARVQVLLRACCGDAPAASSPDGSVQQVKIMRRTRGRGRWIHYR